MVNFSTMRANFQNVRNSISQETCSKDNVKFNQPTGKKDSLSKISQAKQIHVIVAAGPGGYAFNHRLIDKITKTVQNAQELIVKSTISIGNGENGISLNRIIDAVKVAKQKSCPITLFLQFHGRNKQGEHEILVCDEEWDSSRELFRKLKSTLGDSYPLSIFMTSCHGGAAAVAAMSELPKGAVFVALTRSTEVVSGFDVERFASSVDHLPWDSSEKLLYHYLTKSLKNRMTPVIAYASKGYLDLGKLFIAQIGQPFTANHQAQAHQQIDDLIGKENVDALIDKIQNARSEYDILAVDYGPALAVVFAGLVKSISDQ